MPFISSIDELNNAFYEDQDQRRYHLPRSKQFFDQAMQEIGLEPSSILCLSRSWISEHLAETGADVSFPQDLDGSQYDLVIAIDEILTREKDESAQKRLISNIMQLVKPGGYLMASLRDYRNTNCHRRPLGDSCYNMLGSDEMVTTEVNQLDGKDKQAWRQKLHVVINDSELACLDLGHRRTLYFKQMAKYCTDAGASTFAVSKNLHWKGHLRRMPENIAFAGRSA